MAESRGLMRVVSNDELNRQAQAAAALVEEAAREAAKTKDQVLTGLAGYVMPLWHDAKQAKQEPRQRLMAALRQRRGEYEPDKLAEIKETGGSEIFMMITSVKCRAAGAWLRDALLGQGFEKPWTIAPTPNPQLPDDAEMQLLDAIGQEVGQMAAMGAAPPPALVRQRIDAARDSLKVKLREQARTRAQDTERVLEDELIEGGFSEALDQFIDDFVTYPAAILKGPVIHRAPVLKWEQQASVDENQPPRWIPVVEDKLVKKWYRVDPFKFYPAPWASQIADGYCFEHHRITSEELHNLIGAPGYDEEAIRRVIQNQSGLKHWLGLDWFNSADNLNQPKQYTASEGPMDALEFYGTVPGKYLIEWGVDDPEVTDPEKSYNVNLWLVGNEVIKATINPDPLGKKPYRKGSYEEIPGAFWGRGVPDLIADVQQMCNAAARALANNMGISSGPQVAINIDRIPMSEKVTQLYPWKIHQFKEAPMGGTAPPMEFFQPQSNANELMQVFSFFSGQADEYSGLPKYMSGDTNIGGAGRTASGLSSLMSNSNRLMKTVMASIDRITTDSLQTLHEYLMQWEFDRYPELAGDIRIVAKGATSVMAREQLAMRRSEFLQATGNPLDMQIMGIDGRGYLLRESARQLDLDTDRIIAGPPPMPMGGQPGQPAASPEAQGQSGSPEVVRPNMRPPGATHDALPAP